MVLRDKCLLDFTPADREAIRITYPAKFELRGAAEMAATMIQFQQILSLAGEAPQAEAEMLMSIERQLLPDLTDEQYAQLDAEINELMVEKNRLKVQMREAIAPGLSDAAEVEGEGSSEQGAGEDRLGQSSATRITGTMQYQV